MSIVGRVKRDAARQEVIRPSKGSRSTSSGSGGGGVAGAGDQTVIVKVYADSEVIAEKVLSMQRFNERRGI